MIKHESMRGYFAYELYQQMEKNKNIWLVVGDLGYKVFDQIRDDFPDRFLNAGASEQAAAGICVGLALEGKIPFFYSITSFLIYRPFETIRLYLQHEKIPVKLVGSGRDYDYAHDGISHWSHDINLLFGGWRAGEGDGILNNIVTYFPEDKEEIPNMVEKMVTNDKPSFISLRR